MKNRLLPLVFVLGLGSYSAYSQVGIGTNNPYAGAQLEIKSANKGVLIPRVELKALNNSYPISAANLTADANSMLVFNTATIADVTPGYYYWTTATNSWNRIVTSAELSAAAGTAAGTGVPGDKGQAGYPGAGVNIYTDTNTNIVYVQNTDGTWSAINSGKDGVPGGAGAR